MIKSAETLYISYLGWYLTTKQSNFKDEFNNTFLYITPYYPKYPKNLKYANVLSY